MKPMQGQSRKRPANTAGEDPWSPWIELMLGIGRALWGCQNPRASRAAQPAGAATAPPDGIGRLVLVHSSATVVVPARKPRRSPLRLVVRMRRADA